MEATNPPRTPGFDRKPKSRNRKSNRKPGRRKGGFNPTVAMPSEATAWLYGSMFLITAAKLLAPLMGINVPATQPVNVNND